MESGTKARVTSGGILALFPKRSEVHSHPFTYPEASLSFSSLPVISRQNMRECPFFIQTTYYFL